MSEKLDIGPADTLPSRACETESQRRPNPAQDEGRIEELKSALVAICKLPPGTGIELAKRIALNAIVGGNNRG